jgi:signal transduction histidine kinase
LSLERRTVDLAALVEHIVEDAWPELRHPIHLTAPVPVWASVDVPRLEQTVRSLLDLVRRYALGAEPVDVAVYRTPEGAAAVAVGQRGADLPAEYQRHLAHRFTRSSSEHRPAGLGLGLYVSRHVVEGHGGTIVAETPPEGGTRLVAVLPGAPPPPPEDGS